VSGYGRSRRLASPVDRPLVVSADSLPPQPLVASIQPEPPLRWSLTTIGSPIVEVRAVTVRPFPDDRSDAFVPARRRRRRSAARGHGPGLPPQLKSRAAFENEGTKALG
jgi:hypothetical protein